MAETPDVKKTTPVARRSALTRSLPIGYLAAAIVLVAVLLPTALRPPQDQQNTSAAFSPDAPPDDAPPEALLQSLRQARSSTAGAREQTIEVVDEAPPPPPKEKKASKAGCYGDPPRQTESIYSALCVPAWVPPPEGNGGKTWRGVFPDEIRLGMVVASSSDVPEGRLGREFSETDVPEERDLKMLQTYFNDRFETYGRYLQLYIVRQSTSTEDGQRASVQLADSYELFAMLGNASAASIEAIRLGMIDVGSVNYPVDFYNDNFPYAYSFSMDSWQTRYIGSELICKHFGGGKPPGELNERMDESFDYNAPRKFGLVSYQDTARTGATAMITDRLRQCGIELTVSQEYNLTSNQASLGGVMTKFRAAGVTTVILNVDGLTPTVLTDEADRQGYFPEYVHTGTGGLDSAATGRLMNDRQARHVVGLSPNEIPRFDEDKDWYRAFKEVDPESTPEPDMASEFRNMQQLAGAIQWAGPKLNPDTLWKGFHAQPYREPQPQWSIGGGYRDNLGWVSYKDLTYEDYLSIIWFDQTQRADGEDLVGAWCHVWSGRRFRVSELPTEPIPWFDRSQCIVSAPRGEQG